ADRFASAAEFARALSDIGSTATRSDANAPTAATFAAPTMGGRTPLYRDARTWISATALAVALAVVVRAGRTPSTNVEAPIISTLMPGTGEDWNITGTELALSPDASQLVVGSLVEGANGPLLLRSLNKLGSVVLP